MRDWMIYINLTIKKSSLKVQKYKESKGFHILGYLPKIMTFKYINK